MNASQKPGTGQPADTFSSCIKDLEERTQRAWKHLQSKRRDRQAYFLILRNEQKLCDWLRNRSVNAEWSPPTTENRRDRRTRARKFNPSPSASRATKKPKASCRYAGATPLPSPELGNTGAGGSRAWTSPAYVELVLDKKGPRRNAALAYLKRFVTSDCDVIFREWAKNVFGDVDQALGKLNELCHIQEPKDGKTNNDWQGKQKERLCRVAEAWQEHINRLDQKNLTGTQTRAHLETLVSRIKELDGKVPSSNEAKSEWRRALEFVIKPKGPTSHPNLVSALAGQNMSKTRERCDTILSFYGRHFHKSTLRSGDTMVKFIQARVEGYLSGLNGDQPLAEFPYLSRFSSRDPVDVLYEYLKNDYLPLKVEDRLGVPAELTSLGLKRGEKRSEHLERFTKLYHAAFSKRRTGTKQRGPWGNRKHRTGAVAESCVATDAGFYVKGEADKTEWAVLLWDKDRKAPVLLLSVPKARAESICVNNLVQLDGSPLTSTIKKGFAINGDLGRGLVLPVKFGHDFRRWWRANISNDVAHAPSYRRAIMKSFKMVILDPDDTPNRPARVFIQPSFSFGEGERKPDRKSLSQPQPLVRWLVGIDWGITFPIYAAVLDTKNKTVTHAECVSGKAKIEHSKLATQGIAEANRKLAMVARERPRAGADAKRWRRTYEKKLENARQAVRKARRSLRSVSAFDVVEAASRLVSWVDGDNSQTRAPLRGEEPLPLAGRPADYLFVIEDLKRPDVGDLKRVQSLLRTREALKHQLRRRGFPARRNHRRGFPWGMEEVDAAGTSKLGLSGWMRPDAARLNEDKPTGREVGKYIAQEIVNGKHLRGKRVSIGRGKSVFKAAGQPDDDRTRYPDFGQELFWDPELKSWKEKYSEHGWVLPADFVAAVNIAVRLWAGETCGQTKKPGSDAEFEQELLKRHRELLGELDYACDVRAWKPIVENEKLEALQPVV